MQVAPGGRLPPAYWKKPVGKLETAMPPQLFIVAPVACRPVRAASRSSSNAMPVTVSVALKFVRVSSRLTEPPGPTGSPMNSFVNARMSDWTVSVSLAGGSTTGAPMVAERSLVEFR